MKVISYCKYCNKEILDWKKRCFCNKTCENLYKKGRPVGKYSDYQVNSMVKGKKDAYIQRVLQMEKDGKYNLDEIKEILKYVPINSTRQLAKILGFKESDSRAPVKELKYLLEYYKLDGLLRKEKYPECYTTATVSQMKWFNSVLERCEHFYNFTNIFLEEYKNYNARKAMCLYKNVILYVQYSGIKTKALREGLSKNLKNCGTTCEKQVRKILEGLNCKFIDQAKINYGSYICKNETKERYHFYRPDFIVDDKFIIEVNGDYWHAYNVSPEDMTKDQIKRTSHDVTKYEFYKEENYRFIIIWEHELVNIDKVKNRITEEILNEGNYKRIIYN